MRLGKTLAAGLACIALGACSKHEQDTSSEDSELSEIQTQEDLEREAETKRRDEERAANVRRSKEAMKQGKEPPEEEPTELAKTQPTENQGPSEEEWKRIEDKMFTRYLTVREKLGSLTIGGETFEEIAISGVDHKGLTITHKTGKKDLLYTDLPAGLRAKMLVDDNEAADIARGVHLPKLPRKRAKAVRDRVVEARKTLRPTPSPTNPPSPETAKPSKREEDPVAKKLRIADEKRKEAAIAVRDAQFVLDELKERLTDLREGGAVRRSQNDPQVRKAAKVIANKEAILKRLKAAHRKAEELAIQIRKEQLIR